MDARTGLLVLLTAALLYLRLPSPSHRVDNFSAGPGSLPETVLDEAAREFSNYHGSGMGLFEMSHRDVDGPVQTMLTTAARDMKTLLRVPATHEVLRAAPMPKCSHPLTHTSLPTLIFQ